MARNEEKAQALLNRFVTAKREANRPDKSQRPYLASECEDVGDCELCGRP
jgi:pre-mRNA-splicing factor ISY1